MNNKKNDWDEFIKDVTPLSKHGVIKPQNKPVKRVTEKKTYDEKKMFFMQSDFSCEIFKKEGIDKNLRKKIKNGSIKIDATLDLHGKKYTESKEQVYDFVNNNYYKGKRLLLIITGKGRRLGVEEGWQGSGILREHLPKWLSFKFLRNIILWIEDAPPNQGGQGAKLVYLKKIKE